MSQPVASIMKEAYRQYTSERDQEQTAIFLDAWCSERIGVNPVSTVPIPVHDPALGTDIAGLCATSP